MFRFRKTLLLGLYIPPSNSRFSSVELLLDYYIDDYYHVICGDFNAHTSIVFYTDHVNDYVSDDGQSNIILDMMHNLIKCNIPIERYSCDTSNVNDGYGKKLLELCKKNVVCTFNGRVGDLRTDKAATVFNTVVDWLTCTFNHGANIQGLQF